MDFECHNIEHQLGAFTDCNHGCGLAVIHPTYYRHIYQEGLSKFVKFAQNVWDIPREDKSDDEIARAGIDALEHFIAQIGLPATLTELGITDAAVLDNVAETSGISPGSYKKMTAAEVREILEECRG